MNQSPKEKVNGYPEKPEPGPRPISTSENTPFWMGPYGIRFEITPQPQIGRFLLLKKITPKKVLENPIRTNIRENEEPMAVATETEGRVNIEPEENSEILLISEEELVFSTIQEADKSPLALRLFGFPWVEKVTFNGGDLSLTLANWVGNPQRPQESPKYPKNPLESEDLQDPEQEIDRNDQEHREHWELWKFPLSQIILEHLNQKEPLYTNYEITEPWISPQTPLFQQQVESVLHREISPRLRQEGKKIKFQCWTPKTQTLELEMEDLCRTHESPHHHHPSSALIQWIQKDLTELFTKTPREEKGTPEPPHSLKILIHSREKTS